MIYRISTLLLLAIQLQAANWYVRPSGGSGSGTSWTAAWNGLNGISWSSLSAGDTVWVAGGLYSQDLDAGKSGSSGNPITIARARADSSACTGSAGWSAGYDSDVVQTNKGIYTDNYDYVTVDGSTSASGGTWGWHLNCPSFTAESYASTYYNSQGILLRYVHFEGPGYVTYSGDARGISLSAAGDASGITFDHVKVNKFTTAVFINGPDNITFQYCDFSDCSAVNSSSWHPNGIWSSGCVGLTVKYCAFYKGSGGYGCGEGIFSEQGGGNSDWSIIGNLFYDLDETGTKAIEITSSTPNLKIFNNTFDNVLNSLYTQVSAASGTEVKNNIISRSGDMNYGTVASNLTTTSSGVFVDRANHDFHIVATTGAGYPRDAGVNLGASYNTDMDGVTRGSDGTWDVGAYEYDAGGGDTTPPAFSSASINTAGTTITVVMGEATVTTINTGLTISVNGGGAQSCTYSSGSGSTSLVYTCPQVYSGQTVTVSYTQPGNGWEDAAGNDVVTFSGQAVTNNSTQEAPATSIKASLGAGSFGAGSY